MFQLRREDVQDFYRLALLSYHEGDLERATDYLEQVVSLRPGDPEPLCRLADAYLCLGKEAEAESCFEKALIFKPDCGPALLQLGILAQESGNWEKAFLFLGRAEEVEPGNPQTLHALGYFYLQTNQFDRAISQFEKTLKVEPGRAETHACLGAALAGAGQTQSAEQSCRKSLALEPENPLCHFLLGRVHELAGTPQMAQECYREALDLQPDLAEAHNNLGALLRAEGKLQDAIHHYRQAIAANPNFAEAHMNLGMAHLQKGNFREGWSEYEWRQKNKLTSSTDWESPAWEGQNLSGKTILLHAEQGFGDSLQFVRFASRIKSLGATVLLQCQEPLVEFLASQKLADAVIHPGQELPQHDYQLSLGSLPHALEIKLEDLLSSPSYLKAEPARVEASRKTMEEQIGFRVGLCWQGNPNHSQDHLRSMNPALLECLSHIDGVQLFSLQKGPGEENAVQIPGIHHLARSWNDFADAAADISCLDLVISVDTSIAHLAGALGKPIWLMVPDPPEWRWMWGREDSPWYPTMRIFRQDATRRWEPVLERVRRKLAHERPEEGRRSTS